MPQTHAAITCRRLCKEFDGRRVLREIDLDVAPGEALALVGENGAGKTTLLRCLAGIVRTTAGEVAWFGQPAGRTPEGRQLIGVVAHDSMLCPQLTPRENLVFTARLYGLADPRGRAGELLNTIGLAATADRPTAGLSAGMRQRLAIARAVVHRPPIMFLDEPFAGLDQHWSDWLTDTLLELRRRQTTLCLVLHDMEKVAQLADRVLIIRGGRLEEQRLSVLRRAA